MSTAKKTINFSAGPSKVPEEVVIKAQQELLDHHGCGLSVMEMSHRSKFFESILKETEKDLRELVNIPDNYKVLFLQGGGTGQFASVPLNLATADSTVDYIVTGTWSSKAAKEAEKYCKKVNYVVPKGGKFLTVADQSEWKLSENASYLYYCDNETIHGIEFPDVPKGLPNIPLVCDMSSNFLTRPFDVTKFGCIFAGAQKNVGIAGLTVVIVREDLIGKEMPICPTIFNYKIMSDNDSMYNTPNCFAIYITGLCLKWIKERGGLEGMKEKSSIKSNLVYNTIKESDGFYSCSIDKKYQSRVNIPFRIAGGDESLEKKFLEESAAKGMMQLKGHRSVGGLRASLFNALTIEEAEIFVEFMKQFQQKYKQ